MWQPSIYYIVWQIGLLHLGLRATIQAADWFAWNLISMLQTMLFMSMSKRKYKSCSLYNCVPTSNHSLIMLHISLVSSQLTENAVLFMFMQKFCECRRANQELRCCCYKDQTEEGDYWECFWTETEQHAIIPSSLEKHLSSASLLLLYGQPALLMMLWYVASPSITSLNVISRWVVLAHL